MKKNRQNYKNRQKSQEQFNRPTPEILVKDTLSYKYTQGKEFTTINGEEYIGEYHIRKDGKYYTGPTPPTQGVDNSQQLLQYYENYNNFEYDKLKSFASPVKSHTDPVQYEYTLGNDPENAYRLGYDTRYFVQRIGIGTYAIEIDQAQRDRFGSSTGIDSGIYRLADVHWQLTGTLEFIERTNKDRINQASQLIPDLPFIIRNYAQYARITNQSVFSSMDSQLRTKDKFMSGRKVTFKQTVDRNTGLIIPPKPFERR